MNDWPTKIKDLKLAQIFIEEYADFIGHTSQTIGLFEVETDIENKKMDMRLSPWVTAMTIHFQKIYGVQQGENVTRKVLSYYFIQGQTIH